MRRPIIFSELSPAGLQNVSRGTAREYLEALVTAGYAVSTIEASGDLMACGTDVDRVLEILDRLMRPIWTWWRILAEEGWARAVTRLVGGGGPGLPGPSGGGRPT
jgi:hypothetical protein